MRKRIYEIIEVNSHNKLSRFYDTLMVASILISVVPLAFKHQNIIFFYIDKITCAIFILDYLLRLLTADYKLKRKTVISFLLYPITPMAIIDLLSILPSLTVLNSSFKLFKIFRLLKSFKIFKLFKAARYSKSINMIIRIFQKQRHALLTVCAIAIGYILVSALIILNIEPDTFDNYFDAVYWATVSLTTVGYGDIYPVTTAGKIITMISSLFGTAIIALPAGIITAGIMTEIDNNKKNE